MAGDQIKKVVILAFENTAASTFVGPLDVFSQAGVLWNRLGGLPTTSFFEPELVTLDGAPFRCSSGLTVQPQRSLHEVKDADIIIISSMGKIRGAIEAQIDAVPWLLERHEHGARIASVCTGAFLLAETGLLCGKTATTHWGFASMFRQRFPEVHLKPERMVTDEGDLFCSAGFMAGVDLSLYLVRQICGPEVALQCAKALIYDTNRTSQTPYYGFQTQKEHRDLSILSVQAHLEEYYSKKIRLEHLAKDAGMSIRTFERRFKAATGDTPFFYLQRVRVEVAKRLLEETCKTFEEITFDVGYEDRSFFRKVFVNHTGLKPQSYRRKFQSLS